MKSFLLRTNERTSDRFEKLCEALGAVNSTEEMNQVFLHLTIWFLRWNGDDDLDSGIWFDVTPSRLGMWAEHPAPLKWGNAMIKAGYAVPLDSFYPAEVLKGRAGYFHPGSLDTTWHGVHRHRASSPELFHFIQDRARRASEAKARGVPTTLFEGSDWFTPPASGSGEYSYQQPAQGQRGGQAPPGGNSGSYSGSYSGGNSEGSTGGNSGDSSCAAFGGAAGGTPLRIRLDVNEDNEINQRNVSQGNSKMPKRMDGRTAFVKSSTQLSFIRANKYDNPLACLKRLDDGPSALRMWHKALKHDSGAVCQILAEITETDQVWLPLENPAAIVYQRLKSVTGGT